MLAAERQELILERIEETGSVHVEELASLFDVSLMTIRRDLEKLRQEDRIERCHGGAVARKEVPYMDKQISHEFEKQLIAKKAASLVKNGDTVFLDSGTTMYHIGKKLKMVTGITIITNDLEIAYLYKDSTADCIVCGGQIQKATGSLLGLFANQMMSSIHADIAFFGAASIDSKFNVLTPTMEKAELKRIILDNCNQSYLAVDSSKFNRQAMIKINSLSSYTGVITDKKFSKAEQKLIFEQEIQIIKAESKSKIK